jgi:signal recognition particle subunit SRP68
MEITDYIFKEREEVLLVGDYNAYRAHATRRLHKLRKKLGQTTPKGRKYTAKAPVTSENVATNSSYVLLPELIPNKGLLGFFQLCPPLASRF